MLLLIDDANMEEIRRLTEIYPIDGVTTNPSILAKSGRDPKEVLLEIRDFIREAVGDEALLFVQVIPMDCEGMIGDAEAIVNAIGRETVIKIPAIPEGFRAIRALRARGYRTCGTAVYTPMQAYLAGKAGAEFVAPYVNRIDNMGQDGVETVKAIQDIFDNNDMDTKILAASFKNSRQVLELCEYGVASATCSPAVIDAFCAGRDIAGAAEDFAAAFRKAYGEGKTMKDMLG